VNIDGPWQSRRKPHRLPRAAYRVLGQLVVFTHCAAERRTFLIEPDAAPIVAECLDTAAALYRCAVVAYALMPDHMHYVACVRERGGDLLDMADSFKLRTATLLGRAGFDRPIWLRNYWDRHVRRHEAPDTAIRYVLDNPVHHGLCSDAEDWPFREYRGWPEHP